MPLRDHFHAPLTDLTSWDGLHGAWPTIIVMDLNQPLRLRLEPALSRRRVRDMED